VRARVREALTPHHVPRLVLDVPDLPRTLNGKLSEIAVRETVHGRPVRNADALATPRRWPTCATTRGSVSELAGGGGRRRRAGPRRRPTRRPPPRPRRARRRRRAAPGVVEIPVRLVRRHRAQAASAGRPDGPAAATLVAAGAAGLGAPRGTADLVLAVVELAVGAWVLRLAARGLWEAFRRGGAPPSDAAPDAADGDRDGGAPAPSATRPARVRWEGVAAGALALVEVWHHWHTTGRVRRPTLVVGLFALVMAVGGTAALERRMAGRRPRLRVSREGLLYRASVRRRDRFEARWDDVARVEHAPGALRVVLRDGREWTLCAGAHVGGAALVAAAARAVRLHAPARLAAAEGNAAAGGAGGCARHARTVRHSGGRLRAPRSGPGTAPRSRRVPRGPRGWRPRRRASWPDAAFDARRPALHLPIPAVSFVLSPPAPSTDCTVLAPDETRRVAPGLGPELWLYRYADAERGWR
jgi:hypothetical protein